MLWDTHAWVEFLNNSPTGQHVAKMLETEAPQTAMPTISELYSWAQKNGKDPHVILKIVRSGSQLMEFTNGIAELAGQIHHENKGQAKGFGMVDAMIYATAIANGLKVLTGDPHFEGKRDVIYIGPITKP